MSANLENIPGGDPIRGHQHQVVLLNEDGTFPSGLVTGESIGIFDELGNIKEEYLDGVVFLDAFGQIPAEFLENAPSGGVDGEALNLHVNKTTEVHGIVDTSDLATKDYTDQAEADAITTAQTYVDGPYTTSINTVITDEVTTQVGTLDTELTADILAVESDKIHGMQYNTTTELWEPASWGWWKALDTDPDPVASMSNGDFVTYGTPPA